LNFILSRNTFIPAVGVIYFCNFELMPEFGSMRVIIIFLLILTGQCELRAQYRNKEEIPKVVYQLSGMVLSKNTGQPVSYARVRINHSRRGMIADEKGFYSLPVVETDTLYISSIGYKKTGFVFQDYLKDYEGDTQTQFIYVIHYLDEDSISLPVTTIYPYDSPEKIKTAILAMEIPNGSPEDIARDNLNPVLMRMLMEELPVDGKEAASIGNRMYSDKVIAANKVAMVPFFDPIAVGRYIGYMNERSRQKKEKIYNFWPDE